METKVYKVIILADSRGRDLENRPNKISSDIQFHIEVHPGADLKRLVNRVQQLPSVNDRPFFNLAIILGGICSITKIVYMPYRAAVLQKDTA